VARRIRHDDLLAFLRKHQIPMPAELVDGRFTVLLVDDEEEIIQMMKSYFERHASYTLRTASDGVTALIEVGRSKPDLMILDITIPGVDGVEVCRRIKGDSTNKTAIIAISGQADQEARILEAGADAFMAKPLDLAKLLTETKRFLRIL
jgi:DNA-binding response OmpR family regulator